MENEHEGHRKRLKARFAKDGLDGFEPHNVLELLLFYVIPRGDTNPLAHRLINKFGSFSAVLEASPEELMKVEGVGEQTALFLTMLPQLARKYIADKNEEVHKISGYRDLGAYVVPKFIGRSKEAIMLIALDSKNRIISSNIIAEGDIDRVPVSRRQIMEEAIRTKAARVVLAHNHPKGLTVPSNEDIVLTQDVCKLLGEVGIELIDHIIVSNDDYISMAASGMNFKDYRRKTK